QCRGCPGRMIAEDPVRFILFRISLVKRTTAVHAVRHAPRGGADGSVGCALPRCGTEVGLARRWRASVVRRGGRNGSGRDVLWLALRTVGAHGGARRTTRRRRATRHRWAGRNPG